MSCRGPTYFEGKMTYPEFVWFLLSEEDKKHPRRYDDPFTPTVGSIKFLLVILKDVCSTPGVMTIKNMITPSEFS